MILLGKDRSSDPLPAVAEPDGDKLLYTIVVETAIFPCPRSSKGVEATFYKSEKKPRW
jgi:hypothetical protein